MDPASNQQPESESGLDQVATPPPLPPALRTNRDRFVLSKPPPVEIDTPSSALVSAICVVEDDSHSRPRKESAVWSGSIVLHAVILVVVALLVAPADLGGTAMHIIQLSFADDPKETQTEQSVEFVSMEAKPAPDAVEIDVIVPEPAPMPNNGSVATDTTGTGDGTKSSQGGKGADGARGSFFGIEASGQNFVYVLDQSGSMDGQRFRRAADELIRSVETLHEDQKFFVVLFNTHMHQMFDQKGLTPNAVRATRENKRRLAEWLGAIQPTGGTDPRMGLKLALQMNPSAVFMLSDGEFTDDRKRRGGILRSDDGNTKQMVQRMESSVPIHAIAFEDPNSCVNMKELASLTGGEYRFVRKVLRDEGKLLELAAAADTNSDLKKRATELAQLADEFSDQRISDNAKRQFREMLFDAARRSLETGRQVDAIVLTEHYYRVQNTDAEDAQFDSLMDAIVTYWERCEVPGELIQAGQKIREFPPSTVSESFVRSLVPRLVEVAAQSRAAETYHVLRELAARHRGSDTGSLCENGRDTLFEELASLANQRRTDGDLVGALEVLAPLRMESPKTAMDLNIDNAVLDLSREILVQARDAADSNAKEQIRNRLRLTLGNDALYEGIRTRFGGSELQARKIMREATRAIRVGDADLARRLLESILDQHCETITAKKAERELADLGPTEIELGESTLFDQMMGVGPKNDARSD